MSRGRAAATARRRAQRRGTPAALGEAIASRDFQPCPACEGSDSTGGDDWLTADQAHAVLARADHDPRCQRWLVAHALWSADLGDDD